MSASEYRNLMNSASRRLIFYDPYFDVSTDYSEAKSLSPNLSNGRPRAPMFSQFSN